MAEKIWDKLNISKESYKKGIIKQLRASGYTVVKYPYGSYEIMDGDTMVGCSLFHPEGIKKLLGKEG